MSAECGAVFVAVESPAVSYCDDFGAGVGEFEIQRVEQVGDVLCGDVLESVCFVVLEGGFELFGSVDASESEGVGGFGADAWKVG